jgi:hypothetical protein
MLAIAWVSALCTFGVALAHLCSPLKQQTCPNTIQDQTGMFVTRLQKAFDQTANAANVDGDGPAEVVARGIDALYK